MEIIIISLLVLLCLLMLALMYFQNRANSKTPNDNNSDLLGEIRRLENMVKDEMLTNRNESNDQSRATRTELAASLHSFGQLISNSMHQAGSLQKAQLETFSANLNTLTLSIEERLQIFTNRMEEKLKDMNDNNLIQSRENRKETKSSLENFQQNFSASVNEFQRSQKEQFFALLQKQTEQNIDTGVKLEQMRSTIEQKLFELQTGNERKLEEMRATVDEKLQKTLETRLGESFRLVSDRLEAVHKGLGDMQHLATGVGDLKRVLTNVKSRGVLGEYQLQNLLDQLLTPDQYAKNVKTKQGSAAIVEFAVKLPGREEKEQTIWLPIDSKFPKEDFELLLDAYDHGSPELIDEHRRNFVKGIKKCAGDICSKYIDPPFTTDFAILFLPFESLYAEVLRVPGLFEFIQRECKIIITGPTTLSALLSSLQMGFRTLAIERRSGEVWQLLGSVKTEFGNFGAILDKTQKKLIEATNVIEQAGVKSRAIERKLRDVQELPQSETEF